jgi:hypothetical protein
MFNEAIKKGTFGPLCECLLRIGIYMTPQDIEK